MARKRKPKAKPIELRYWEGNNGYPRRVYVTGLTVPNDVKVWLERAGTKGNEARVRFSGDPGELSEATIRTIVEMLLPVKSFVWTNIMVTARNNEKRRGYR